MKFLVSAEQPKGKIRFFEKFVIGGESGGGGEYMTRYIIFDCPWFGIFIHEIHRPDATPILHDHPWPFLSIMLRGGYIERYKDMNDLNAVVYVRQVNRVNLKRLRDAHFISNLMRKPTWTLVFVGPTKRVWGYWEQLSASQTLSVSGAPFTYGPDSWYRVKWMDHRNHGGSYRTIEEQALLFRNRRETQGSNFREQERSLHHGQGLAIDPFANDGE